MEWIKITLCAIFTHLSYVSLAGSRKVKAAGVHTRALGKMPFSIEFLYPVTMEYEVSSLTIFLEKYLNHLEIQYKSHLKEY